MADYLNYFIEANLCLLIFGLFYYLVLRNENNFSFSRFYHIAAALLTLIIPLLNFSFLIPDGNAIPVVDNLSALQLPVLFIGDASEEALGNQSFAWYSWVFLVYVAVMIIMFTILCYHIIQIYTFKSLKASGMTVCKDYILIPTNGQLPTFSFMNMLFYDNSMSISDKDRERIIAHEVVHIREKHSLDILLMEFMKVIFWINPMSWWMKDNIQNVHEYLADQEIIQNTDEREYSRLLAKMALNQMSLPLGHHFNKSLTLKRINMMKRVKTKMKTWKWASLIPVVLLIVVAFSCNDEVMSDVNDVAETSTQLAIPVELQPKLEQLKTKYPDAEFAYMETDGTNEKALANLQDVDPKSIAYIKIWEEKERIGIIVNKNGPLKKFVKNGEAFAIVEEPAKPKIGYEALYAEIGQKLKYPAEAREAGVEGTVYVEFIVDTDGSITEVKVAKGVGHGLDELAQNIVASFEPFDPAKQHGEFVKQRIVLPIKFSLDDKENEEFGEAEPLGDDFELIMERDGRTVTGKVLNGRNEPVSGANIIIKGTSSGTVSKKDGSFKITTFKDNDDLVISHISFNTKKINVAEIE